MNMTDNEKNLFNNLHQALSNIVDARCRVEQSKLYDNRYYSDLDNELESINYALWDAIDQFEHDLRQLK